MVVSGYLGQVPQHGGVAIQRGPALAGEGDSGRCPVAAGHFRSHVSGVAQLAQADDRAARGQPGHGLQPGDGKRVAVGQCRQRRDDAQPLRVVD
jgi:hypothetical protein